MPNTDYILRGAAGGLAAGVAAGSIMEAIKTIVVARKRNAMLNPPDATDESTIVLTLPHKTAALEVTSPEVKEFSVDGKGRQTRDNRSGHFGPTLPKTQDKEAQAPDTMDVTYRVLAGLGAALGGYQGVRLLASKVRNKQLKDEADAARAEYLDVLAGKLNKTAGLMTELLEDDGTEKSAAPRGASLATQVFSTLPLSAIIAGSSTAYIVKRILDEQAKAVDEKTLNIPKVKRIVFAQPSGEVTPESRPAPGTSEEYKVATLQEKRAAFATVYLVTDQFCGGGHTKCAAVDYTLRDTGLTREQLDKLAELNSDLLFNFLDAFPAVTNAVMRHAEAGIPKTAALRVFGIGLGVLPKETPEAIEKEAQSYNGNARTLSPATQWYQNYAQNVNRMSQQQLPKPNVAAPQPPSWLGAFQSGQDAQTFVRSMSPEQMQAYARRSDAPWFVKTVAPMWGMPGVRNAAGLVARSGSYLDHTKGQPFLQRAGGAIKGVWGAATGAAGAAQQQMQQQPWYAGLMKWIQENPGWAAAIGGAGLLGTGALAYNAFAKNDEPPPEDPYAQYRYLGTRRGVA